MNDINKKRNSFIKNITLILASTIIFLIFGCNKNNEISNPDIKQPQINIKYPQSGTGVKIGTSLPIDIFFSDDVALSEALVNFHFDDGHSHEKVSPWDSSFKILLSGKEQSISTNIPIPMTAASGPYHLEIECLDKSGNKSATKEILVEVNADGQPQISELMINANAVLNKYDIFFENQSEFVLELSAKLKAEHLDSVFVLMYEENDNSQKNSNSSFQKRIGLSGASTYNLKENIILKISDFEPGDNHFILYIRAIESSGHNTVKMIHLQIKK